ncbi:hypothetical protein GCM10009117_26210 [Gangjinia marincola]|uniref:Uncharacterized protein n=2 Tax=Gangjinia marincola TaxID=578463 RepID=A0ABN1MJS1_9FLAO
MTSCEVGNDPFLITADQVGKLSKETRVSQLGEIYKQDSIVNRRFDSTYIFGGNEIEIYETSGNQLLRLDPKTPGDTASRIGDIRILDPAFKTEKGLSTRSTYKEILENYTIKKIENTITDAVIFLEEIPAYITIDKKHLPTIFQLSTTHKIESSLIPDNAPIDQFWIGWE